MRCGPVSWPPDLRDAYQNSPLFSWCDPCSAFWDHELAAQPQRAVRTEGSLGISPQAYGAHDLACAP